MSLVLHLARTDLQRVWPLAVLSVVLSLGGPLLAERTAAGQEVLREALANHSMYRRWARVLLRRTPRVLAVIAWPNTLIACRAIDRGWIDDVTTNRLRRSTSIAYHRGARSAERRAGR